MAVVEALDEKAAAFHSAHGFCDCLSRHASCSR